MYAARLVFARLRDNSSCAACDGNKFFIGQLTSITLDLDTSGERGRQDLAEQGHERRGVLLHLSLEPFLAAIRLERPQDHRLQVFGQLVGNAGLTSLACIAAWFFRSSHFLEGSLRVGPISHRVG